MLLLAAAQDSSSGSFVKVIQGQLELDGKPYRFLGANFWQGMNLASTGSGGDRARLLRELDRLQKLGVTNLRVLATSEGANSAPGQIVPSLQPSPGVYNQDLFEGLDFLLNEMQKRHMKAVMILNNFWPWSGGMHQYLEWSAKKSAKAGDKSPAVAPDPKHPNDPSSFYSDQKALKMYNNTVRTVISRTNSITGVPYTQDPTIMSWELASEPRTWKNPDDLNHWIAQTSQMVKKLDPNHLVTAGTEGDWGWDGIVQKKNAESPNIDYMTLHIWVQNAGWYDPKNPERKKNYDTAISQTHEAIEKNVQAAMQLHKPLVLEEFGLARDDGSLDPKSAVGYRDQYFHDVLEDVNQMTHAGLPISGAAFWGYSGEAKPSETQWKPGDPFTGDPAHEPQGWYSIYGSDASTLKIISDYATKISSPDVVQQSPLPAGSKPKILFIGDSHSYGTFGNTLDSLLRECSDVASYGVGKSIPKWWEKGGILTRSQSWSRLPDGLETRGTRQSTPALSQLLDEQKPNVVVIEEGADLIWKGDDKDVETQIQILARQAAQSGRTCIWVGPPKMGRHPEPGIKDADWAKYTARLDQIHEILRKSVPETGCKFIDSYWVTQYPDQGGDGIHYDRAGAEGIAISKKWASYVKDRVSALEGVSRKPSSSPTCPPQSWKLNSPAQADRSFTLDKAGLEDRCGWTDRPHVVLDHSSTAGHLNTGCTGRAQCKVSWTDGAHHRGQGNYFLNFRCRSHPITNESYILNHDPTKTDWFQNFKEECDSTASFRAEDLAAAGCEPQGSIAHDLGGQTGDTPVTREAR